VQHVRDRIRAAATDSRAAAQRRAAFLVRAGACLRDTPDSGRGLATVTAMVVPEFADWCAVDVLQEDGSIERLAVAHAEPGKESLGWELARCYPLQPDAELGVAYVIRTGHPELVPEIPAWGLEAEATDARHLRILRELGLRSCVVVPLRSPRGIVGALSLVSAESGRRYGDDDLAFAQTLADLASGAADDARRARPATAGREADVLLEALFDRAPVGLGLWDRDLGVVKVNEALASMDEPPASGGTACPSPGATGLEERLRSASRLVLETGDVHVQELMTPAQAAAGRERHWIATHYPLAVGNEPIGVGAVVTEIPGGESTPDALSGSREQLAALIEAAPNAIITVDRHGTIVLANRKADEMFGYERDELLGRPVELLVPDSVRSGHVANRVGYRDRATVRPMGEGRDLRARRKDGTEFPVEISLGPAETDQGLRVTAVIADITERKRAELRLAHGAARQGAIASLGERALEGAGLDELMTRAVRLVSEHLSTELAGVMEAVPGEDELVLRAGIGFRGVVVGSERVPTQATVSGLALHSDGPVLVTDLRSDPRFLPGFLGAQGAVAGASVLIGSREAPLGTLAAYERAPRAFTPEELTFLQAVANILGDAVTRRRAEEQLRHQALHDPLTGLANRTLMCERLTHWLDTARRRDGALAAVLFIDLNNFKLINDSLGHAAGDRLLTEVAARLGGAVRAGDTIARFGGDEFAILCEDLQDEREAAAVAERIDVALVDPYDLDGHDVVVTASTGIAFATEAADSADHVLRAADAAMYRAKERGPAGYAFADPGSHGRAVKRLDLESALRDALRADGFFLVYQPLVSVPTGAIVGLEALIRWDHRRYGHLGPADFIPVAEATGLIVPISLFALQEACRQSARWNAGRAGRPPLRVAVNLSAMQLGDELPRRVHEAMTAAGTDPSGLCLEITETTVMRDAPATARTLAALKDLGVRLAIDDFGTGYSSLAYLRRFPVDELKIDGSFVRGIDREDDDTAIVSAIISMAHSLELEVVAEGVEAATQLAQLRRLGADLAQGYHLARPARTDAIDRLLAADLRPRPAG